MNKTKTPYNCYVDRKGYVMPKSPAVKNSPEIIEWLSTFDGVRFMFTDKPNTKEHKSEWLVIGISHSYIGNIYCFSTDSTQEWFEKYEENNPYVKIFDEDFESFKKYMTWVGKLGPWFTKQNINKTNK